MKWQWLQLWTNTSFLDESLHSLPYLRLPLSRFTSPSNLGRLPTGIGLASAGSLKAEQWPLFLAAGKLLMYGVFYTTPPRDHEQESIKVDLNRETAE